LYPALPGACHPVHRNMVPARNVDPHCCWCVARSTAVALVNSEKPIHNRHYRRYPMTLCKRAALLVLICVGLELGSAEDLRAQSSSPRGPAVVELYTSQGCSSCPPADALLGVLSQMPNVLALPFHVDYWDDIGWRDHFALPMARERQRRYVETLRLSSAFTPQVVDGRSSFVGSGRRRLPTLGEERTPGGRSESLNRQTIPHFR